MADNAVLGRLAGVGETRAVKTAIRRLEEYATPAEFAAAARMKHLLTAEGHRILKKSIVGRQVAAARPEPYRRTELHPNVLRYSASETAAEEKTLLVLFAGAALRVMIPIGAVLQSLPGEAHDVVLMSDPGRDHYERGIAGYAESLPAVVQRLRAELDVARYRRVVTLGTSMGGLPALRAGSLLGADLAISVGGRPVWHIDRLSNPDRRTLPAFDLLCPCGPAGPDMFLVYAAHNAEDVEGADLIAAMRPVRRIAVASEEHNVLMPVLEAGRAGSLLAALLVGDETTARGLFAAEHGDLNRGIVAHA